MRCLAQLAAALCLALPLPALGHPHAPETETAPREAASDEAEGDPEASAPLSFLPGEHAFEPLLADMKEPVPRVRSGFQVTRGAGLGVTTSLKGGVERKADGSTRSLRLLLVYLDGFVPFGQFFDTERVESYGIELQVAL